jgi:hypothetical protein
MKNLLELKIERELRTTYIVAAKTAKTFAKASKKTKILIYYDAHAKPGDTGDEVPASTAATMSL